MRDKPISIRQMNITLIGKWLQFNINKKGCHLFDNPFYFIIPFKS